MRLPHLPWIVGVLAACSAGDKGAREDLGLLRVSTHSGVAPISAKSGDTMTAHLAGLIGRYEQSEFEPGRLVLRRRLAGGGPAFIEVRGMASEEEEWRRLLGREVDLVPNASPSHLRYLRQVPSIRIAPVTHPSTAALLFRVRDSRVANPRLRRAISLALRRRAVAESVSGDAHLAVSVEESLPAALAILRQLAVDQSHPISIRLLIHEATTDLQRAALVVQEQLFGVGIDLELEATGYAGLRAAMETGDFDAILFWGGYEPRYWRHFVAGPAPVNYTGYSSPEFDEAAARHDAVRARAVLERDVPLTPLYVIDEAVALDRSLCGAHPDYSYDMSWLADLHRCRPGEME